MKFYVYGPDYMLVVKGAIGAYGTHRKAIYAVWREEGADPKHPERGWAVQLITKSGLRVIGPCKLLGHITKQNGHYIATAEPHTWTFNRVSAAMRHLYINARL